jgi:Ca-activated chloride channel family protein
MSFIWPPMLFSLALVPAGLLLYRFMDRRRRRRLAAYGGPMPAQKIASRQGVLRRIPAAMVLVGLTVMLVALARPEAVVSLPRQDGTVILAFDVSASMAATDLAPSRIEAAKVAAKDFVARDRKSVV